MHGKGGQSFCLVPVREIIKPKVYKQEDFPEDIGDAMDYLLLENPCSFNFKTRSDRSQSITASALIGYTPPANGENFLDK